MKRVSKWRGVVVLTVTLLLFSAIITQPASGFWGLVDYTKLKIGATWGGQAVNVVSTQGCPWYGSFYLYNNPCDFVQPFDPSKPGGLGAGGVGYAPFALGPDKNGKPWQLVMLPPPPPGGSLEFSPFSTVQVFWNFFDWPEDAKHQYVVQVTHGGYITTARDNNFYAAPPGAKCVPTYAHTAFCRRL